MYLGQDPDGDQVEIIWLRGQVPDGPAVQRVAEALTALHAPSLARVTAAGLHEGRPYAVCEQVTGTSLEDQVTRGGPWAGPALHRLGIAMASALMSLHQQGLTHGDLRPGTVLAGSDGIRVLGHGLDDLAAAHMRPSAVTSRARQEADLLGWAVTLLFAATGTDAGPEPDLRVLDDHLRPLVAACLAPGQRPEAAELLLRLVGHSTQTIMALHGGPPERTGRRIRGALVAGGVAVAVLAAAAGHLVGLRVTAEPSAGVPAAPSVPDLLATTAGPAPLPRPAGTLRAPGLALTLHENTADPQRIVGYTSERGAWLRTGADGGFAAAGVPAEDLAAAPDGSRFALHRPGEVTFVARPTGERFAVQVPASAAFPVWDRASSRLLLTLTGPGEDRPPTGWVVVEVASRQVRQVDTDEERHRGLGPFAWSPAGDAVVVSYRGTSGTGLRFRDLTGREVRTMPWTGTSVGRNPFSPSGRLILTHCPSGGSLCAWDAGTGARVDAYVNSIKGAEMWGWFDDDHLMILDATRTPNEFVAIDFRERTRRLLATLAPADNTPGLRLVRAAR